MTTIKLSRTFEMPAAEAVTQTFGILAKRGGGKSNAAAVMAEDLHAAGEQIVVVDPVGAWWGLRANALGNPEHGLQIPILGGYHGDIPLEPAAGGLIADLIVEQRLSAVVDVSAFETEGPKRRFLAEFAERLYTAKGKPGRDDPVHLFLEEADDYAPQSPRSSRDEPGGGYAPRCLGAFQRIVKRGRSRGIGSTMISQRSAALNKDLLTQVETLIVLRTTSPTDRKAIEGWVKYHDADLDILSTLSSLAIGEAWVWSPAWLERVERVKIRRRRTFDSGATPTGGKRKAPATLADVDLGELETRMAATIEKAKDEDPKQIPALRRRVEELEKSLEAERARTDAATALAQAANAQPEPEVVEVEVPVLDEKTRNRLDHLSTVTLPALEKALDEIRAVRDGLETFDTMERLKAANPVPPKVVPPRGHGLTAERLPTPVVMPEEPRGVTETLERVSMQGPDLGKGAKTVLGVLRQWPEGRTANELAFLAGYSAKASTIRSILTTLRKAGLIEPSGSPIRLTEAGVQAAGGYEPIPSGPALLAHWRRHPKMGVGERTTLDVLVAAYPNELSHGELCALTGYSEEASTMRSILTRLRKLGLVESRGRRLSAEFAEAIR